MNSEEIMNRVLLVLAETPTSLMQIAVGSEVSTNRLAHWIAGNRDLDDEKLARVLEVVKYFEKTYRLNG